MLDENNNEDFNLVQIRDSDKSLSVTLPVYYTENE